MLNPIHTIILLDWEWTRIVIASIRSLSQSARNARCCVVTFRFLFTYLCSHSLIVHGTVNKCFELCVVRMMVWRWCIILYTCIGRYPTGWMWLCVWLCVWARCVNCVYETISTDLHSNVSPCTVPSSQITASKSVWFEPSVLNGVGHLNKNELTNISKNSWGDTEKPYTHTQNIYNIFFSFFCFLPSLRLLFFFKLFICSFCFK